MGSSTFALPPCGSSCPSTARGRLSITGKGPVNTHSIRAQLARPARAHLLARGQGCARALRHAALRHVFTRFIVSSCVHVVSVSKRLRKKTPHMEGYVSVCSVITCASSCFTGEFASFLLPQAFGLTFSIALRQCSQARDTICHETVQPLGSHEEFMRRVIALATSWLPNHVTHELKSFCARAPYWPLPPLTPLKSRSRAVVRIEGWCPPHLAQHGQPQPLRRVHPKAEGGRPRRGPQRPPRQE